MVSNEGEIMWQDVLKVRNIWLGESDSGPTFSDKRALYFVWNFLQEDINKTDSFFRDNYFTHKQFSSFDVDEDKFFSTPVQSIHTFKVSYMQAVNDLKAIYYNIIAQILAKNRNIITEEESRTPLGDLKMSKERLNELYNKVDGDMWDGSTQDPLKYVMVELKEKIADIIIYVSKRDYQGREDPKNAAKFYYTNAATNKIVRDYKLHLMERYG